MVKANNNKDPDCPLPTYIQKKKTANNIIQANNSHYGNNNNTEEPSLGSFGNGWSDTGRLRYCDLMYTINKSRALYKDSFDKRMKKFANNWTTKEKNERKKQSTSIFNMTLDNDLPSNQDILLENDNVRAMEINKSLEEELDAVPI